jgi:diguanylate cyclase (GGDEF)-like protein
LPQPDPRLPVLQRLPRIALCALIPFLMAAAPITQTTAGPGLQAAKTAVDRATLAMRADPEASRASAEAALELLKRTPDPDLSIRARLVLCDYYSERDYSAAVGQLEFAIALLPKAQRPGLRAGVLACQGDTTEAAGDIEKAGAFLEQAVAIAESTKDDEMLAQALYSRGGLTSIQGNFANGLADLRRAQTLYEHLNMPLHALTVHNNIAILYSRMSDYATALEIYTRTLKGLRKAGMRRDTALTLHNIGRSYEHLGQWNKAYQAYEESHTLSHELNYARGEAYALRGMAGATTGLGDARTALKTLDEATMLQKQISDASLAARIQLTRGKALHQLHRLNESAAALELARRYYSQANNVIDLGGTYEELAEVYAAQGLWRAAYGYRAQAQTIEQKLFRSRFDQRFATLKVEFDTAAKEKENELLTRENQANQRALTQERSVQKLQAAVIGLAALLLILLGAVAWHQRRTSVSMRSLAMTDELTGAPNRRAALRRLARVMHRHDAEPCAVLIIDIDHFKSINDRHGHPEGDEALKLVAAKLRQLVQAPALFGRLGGEEFIAVLPDTRLEGARLAGEIYRTHVMQIDARRWVGDKKITVSIGISVSRPGVDTPTTMLQRADAALYAAKHAGRNCVMTEADATPANAATLADA